MDIIQCSTFGFEIQDTRPRVPREMYEWFLENDIKYDTNRDKYGPGDCHYLFYVILETEEDAMAFKLRWT